MPSGNEPRTIDELIERLRRIQKCKVNWRPRLKPGETWKDPWGCLWRLGITEADAERFLSTLTEQELHKGPTSSYDPKWPEDKWVFYTPSPPGVTPSCELYIKISSKSGSEITIESFHEREKPEDLIEEDWI